MSAPLSSDLRAKYNVRSIRGAESQAEPRSDSWILCTKRDSPKKKIGIPPFKRDIDELINQFVEEKGTSLADMKIVWLFRKFSYIYDASPTTNLAFFVQSLYAHSIGYMVNGASLSYRLGGVYCLYCLYEIQPFKPPFRIYFSLGELKKLKVLVREAKEQGIEVVCSLVKRMLDKNMFLFGSVDINGDSVTERVNQLAEQNNAKIQLAYKMLFNNYPIEQYIHMDMGAETGSDMIEEMSDEYAKAKKLAIEEACKVVAVEDIRHIAVAHESIRDTMRSIADNWNLQKRSFNEQIELNQQPAEGAWQMLLEPKPADDDEGFDQLEQLLSQT